MQHLSARVMGIQPSATLAVDAKAKELASRGISVISFGAGEPDFEPPSAARRAAIRAIRDNDSYYTPVGGLKDLKEAICEKYQRMNIVYEPKNIVVSNGAKHSLFNITQCLLNPGDEAILFSPYWVTYEEQIRFAGAKPVIVPAREEDDFTPRPEDVEKVMNERTKLIILNSPCNPTGAVFPEKVVRAIVNLALQHGVYIVSDEIYAEIAYERKPVRVPSLGDDVREHTILVDGVSKSYAMTGWRVGWSACAEDLAKAMEKLQSHTTSNVCNIAQRAAIGALSKPIRRIHVRAFRERRDYMLSVFRAHDIPCVKPLGAFYVFPNIRKFGKSSLALSEELLMKARVAVVPGIAFGSDAHIRLSFATSQEKIEEGMRRLVEALS